MCKGVERVNSLPCSSTELQDLEEYLLLRPQSPTRYMLKTSTVLCSRQANACCCCAVLNCGVCSFMVSEDGTNPVGRLYQERTEELGILVYLLGLIHNWCFCVW